MIDACNELNNNKMINYVYSSFRFRTFLQRTGSKERAAINARIRMDCMEMCPVAVVSS